MTNFKRFEFYDEEGNFVASRLATDFSMARNIADEEYSTKIIEIRCDASEENNHQQNMRILIDQSDFSEMSSEKAEEEHHKECKYACCGEHNDFVDYTKCPKCGMTESIQDEHNDEVWSYIDEIESVLLRKYRIIGNKQDVAICDHGLAGIWNVLSENVIEIGNDYFCTECNYYLQRSQTSQNLEVIA